MSVGNVQKYIIKSIGNGITKETEISNKFLINPNSSYSDVDTASKSLIALSTDIYTDTSLITDISVNEHLNDDTPTFDYVFPEDILMRADSTSNGYITSSAVQLPENIILLGTMILSIRNSLIGWDESISQNRQIKLSRPSINFYDSSRRAIITILPSSSNINTPCIGSTQYISGEYSANIRTVLQSTLTNVIKIGTSIIHL